MSTSKCNIPHEFCDEISKENQQAPMNNTQLVDLEEAPLSPVLTTSKVNKKLLQHRRKSRVKVKLCNKFHEKSQLSTIKEQEVSETSLGDSNETCLEKGDCSQSEIKCVGDSVGDKVRKIREFENNFDRFYEDLNAVNIPTKLLKKPSGAISKKKKKTGLCEISNADFTTATGKTILVQESSLKQSVQLFDDIIENKIIPSDSTKNQLSSITEADELLNADIKLFEDISEKSYMSASDSEPQNAECSGFISSTTSRESIFFDDATEVKSLSNQEQAPTTLKDDKLLHNKYQLTQSLVYVNEISDSQMIEVACCAELINETACDWNSSDFNKQEQHFIASEKLIQNTSSKSSECLSECKDFKGFKKHEIISASVDLLIQEFLKENLVKQTDKNESNDFKGFDANEIILTNNNFRQFKSEIRKCIKAMAKELNNNKILFSNNSEISLDELFDEMHEEFDRKSRKYKKLFRSDDHLKINVKEVTSNPQIEESCLRDILHSLSQEKLKELKCVNENNSQMNKGHLDLNATAKVLEGYLTDLKRNEDNLSQSAEETNRVFVADFTNANGESRAEFDNRTIASDQNLEIGYKTGRLDLTNKTPSVKQKSRAIDKNLDSVEENGNDKQERGNVETQCEHIGNERQSKHPKSRILSPKKSKGSSNDSKTDENVRSPTKCTRKNSKCPRKRSNSLAVEKDKNEKVSSAKKYKSECSSPVSMSPKLKASAILKANTLLKHLDKIMSESSHKKSKSPSKKHSKESGTDNCNTSPTSKKRSKESRMDSGTSPTRSKIPSLVKFSTASGKVINISVDKLKKAQTAFDEYDVQDFNRLSTPQSLNTDCHSAAPGESAKKTPIANENLSKSSTSNASNLKALKESSKQITPRKLDGNLNMGFSTASGKPLKVTKESLVKAFGKFEEVDENMLGKSCAGFSTASGKTIKVSKENLKKAQGLFDEVDLSAGMDPRDKTETEQLSKQNKCEKGGFSATSGKRVITSKGVLPNVQSDFDQNQDKVEKILSKTSKNLVKHKVSKIPTAFSTASGKVLSVNKQNLKKANAMKEEIDADFGLLEENESVNSVDVTSIVAVSSSGKKTRISSPFKDKDGKHATFKKTAAVVSEVSNILNEMELTNNNLNPGKIVLSITNPNQMKENCNFLTAAGKTISISEQSKERVKDIFNDFEKLLSDDSFVESFLDVEQDESGLDDISKANTSLRTANSPPRKKQRTSSEDIKIKLSSEEPESFSKQIPSKLNKTLRPSQPNVYKKKSLGPQFCQQIEISEPCLNKAKNLFDDIDFPNKSFSSNQHTMQDDSITSQNFQNSVASLSTPEKAVGPLQSSTPINNAPFKKQKQLVRNQAFTLETNLTPIKEIPEPSDRSESTQISECSAYSRKRKKDHIMFQQKKCSDIDEWEQSTKNIFEKMKYRLMILESRIEAINYQKKLIEEGSVEHRRPHAGYLYKIKSNKVYPGRITLKRAVKNIFPECNNEEEAKLFEISQEILEITPRNALDVHFYSPWLSSKPSHNSKDDHPVLKCQDGAVVIPSSDDTIGFLEIECAFKSMQGVDPTIIPDDWVNNHFRWIVWKLAGMDRNLPHSFKGCLSVDNILQQLKYRYDREIDRVERSAIRKILEKDDIPAKRLVLCVSSIVKTSTNSYELDLTDGWYKIRTIIDYPLMQQVNKKIKLGTKLLICGAELLNCEGCSPLEVPSSVKLKINYNSTRRVRWDSKLGYQKIPTPFPISLNSAHLEGGIVRCVKCYIARIYPLKFMEKLKNGGTIWRNIKAENKRAAIWESEKQEKLEMVHSKVREQMEAKEKSMAARKYTAKSIRQMPTSEIRKINCPQTLFEMMEQTSDPDSFRELLTESQHQHLLKYQREGLRNKHHELSMMIKERLQKENISRDVVSVQKVLIFDSNSLHNNSGSVLSIWRPKPEQISYLIEGSIAYIYNVLPKTSSTFSSISQTRFEIVKSELTSDQQNFGRRHLSHIAEAMKRRFSPNFGEFDTVGVIAKISIETTGQEMWLVDFCYRFLYIKIAEGPQTCSLLEGMECGKCVAVSNLIYRSSERYFGKALADHYTIVSYYPQDAYLKNAIDELLSQMPQDMPRYLEDCKNRVATLELMLNQPDRSLIINPLNLVSSRDSLTDSAADDISFSDEGTLLMSRLTDTDVAMSLIDTQQFR